MSRSFKRTPIVKDNKRGRKYFKRHANKKIRKSNEVVGGRHYKKVYNTWNIYDQRSYCTFEEYKGIREYLGEDITDEQLKIDWRRYFKNK